MRNTATNPGGWRPARWSARPCCRSVGRQNCPRSPGGQAQAHPAGSPTARPTKQLLKQTGTFDWLRSSFRLLSGTWSQAMNLDERRLRIRKMKFRSAGKNFAFICVAIEQPETIEARFIQVIMDADGEILANVFLTQPKFRGPRPRDLMKIFSLQPMVT